MSFISYLFIAGLSLVLNTAWADTGALNHYKTLTLLSGDWVLSPAGEQEGGATKKGPAAKLVDTDMTAMSFKVVGKGSAVQENLLPGTGKEMVSMYHCDDFNNCSQVQAKHYCAKQNQPELLLDAERSDDNLIVMTCDMDTALCKSGEGHVHAIKHEISRNNTHLKTTYTVFNNGKYEKDSIYHFDRKQQ